MSEVEFGEMAPPAFFLKLFYFNQQQDQRHRFLADLTRLHAFNVINIQLDPKHKLTSPQQLWSYEWEEQKDKKTTKKQTKEELKELVRQANRIFSGIQS